SRCRHRSHRSATSSSVRSRSRSSRRRRRSRRRVAFLARGCSWQVRWSWSRSRSRRTHAAADVRLLDPMSLRVGIGLFTGQIPSGSPRTFADEYRDTLEMVRRAEALGFDSAWVSEHHGTSDGYLPSLLTMLAAFAAVTERIDL